MSRSRNSLVITGTRLRGCCGKTWRRSRTRAIGAVPWPCLIACFTTIGGVPWVVVTDNMTTAVLGRNAEQEPVWNPAYQKLAVEFKFHPEACAPASGNQKGAVENLVKFVKGNFIAGRTFHDDADLAEQCTGWLSHVNTERPSDATGEAPVVRLVEEQAKFSALPATAEDYG